MSMLEPQVDNSPVFIDGELRVERAHEESPSIEVLPEEVILEIFYFHKLACESGSCEWQERWGELAQVCRRWRTTVFSSQHRLDLRLLCTPKTSINSLDLWPTFPTIIRNNYVYDNWDNIIAALQQRDRVCEIHLRGPLPREVSRMMQEPFPLLDSLALHAWDSRVFSCPSTFLGGFAPHLRVLHLDVFPRHSPPFKLQQILSSAGHLVDLRLERVDNTGCISPEALVAALSATARLQTLYLQFLHATSRSNPRNIPPSSGRIVSFALLRLTFEGPCNYLGDLLSRITTPSLEFTHIKLIENPETPSFDVSQLSQFLGRVESQSLPDGAEVRDCARGIRFSLTRSVALPGGRPNMSECFQLELPFRSRRTKLLLMTQIFPQISPFLSNVRALSIYMVAHLWHEYEHGGRWVDLFRVFSHVEKLYVTGRSTPNVVCALQLVSAEMATDVLPALRELGLDSVSQDYGSQKIVTSFNDVRTLAGLPAITFRRLNCGPT